MAVLVPALLLFILIAAVCGAVGKAIAGEVRGGLIVSIALGFVGALLGAWVAQWLRLPALLPFFVGDQPFPVLWSILAAALVVAILHLASRRRP